MAWTECAVVTGPRRYGDRSGNAELAEHVIVFAE